MNLVPIGLYGDVSGDSHMREVKGEQAESLTFFMYEELDAFRRAQAGGTHHVALVYGNVSDEILKFGKIMGWNVVKI